MDMVSRTIGICGIGEVGTAFLNLLKMANQSFLIYDPKAGYEQILTNCWLIHHCSPVEVIEKNIQKNPFAIHMIHSTVPPGFCKKIWAKGYRIYHAPVNGKHPNLTKSLLSFKMLIGTDLYINSRDKDQLLNYFIGLSINVEFIPNWTNTELAKMLCTTRLGLDVMFMRHAAELCKKFGADFETVYTKWTNIYNEGYRNMGLAQYTRPVLKLTSGPIGGHCVVNNAKYLKNDSWVAALIVSEGPKQWTLK